MKTKILLQDAIKAINDEPEYPGEMPQEMKELFTLAMKANDNIDIISEAMRISVRLTKIGIIKRLEQKILVEKS